LDLNPQSLPEQLDNLLIEQLEELQDQIFDFTSVTDLENWLQQQAREKS
jgi:hypothetical protein